MATFPLRREREARIYSEQLPARRKLSPNLKRDGKRLESPSRAQHVAPDLGVRTQLHD